MGWHRWVPAFAGMAIVKSGRGERRKVIFGQSLSLLGWLMVQNHVDYAWFSRYMSRLEEGIFI